MSTDLAQLIDFDHGIIDRALPYFVRVGRRVAFDTRGIAKLREQLESVRDTGALIDATCSLYAFGDFLNDHPPLAHLSEIFVGLADETTPRIEAQIVDRLVRPPRRTVRGPAPAMVVKDPVTGLFNHKYFHEALERELTRAHRHGHEVGIVLIGVDDLSLFNETSGHHAGDELLADVAKDLVSALGGSNEGSFEVAARFEGDLFAVLLPETTKDRAAALAERIRAAAEKSVRYPTMVSSGVVAYPADGEDRTQLLEACRRLLRTAKDEGRNRVVASSAPRPRL